MEDLHLEELRQLTRLFQDRGFDNIKDRLAVVDGFFATEEHLTPAGLTALLKSRGLDLEEKFVAQTLEMLCRFGFALKKEFAGGNVYEHRHLDDHHDHLICTGCGRIEEFFHPDLESLQRTIAREQGFKLLEHRHQLYGLCAQCQAQRAGSIPLDSARPGERVRVAGYLGGRRSRARLSDLGLTPGTELEILTSNGGPVMIACRGSRIAVGRQMASKLTCRPVETDKGRDDDEG